MVRLLQRKQESKSVVWAEQERPVRADALLGSSDRVIGLAALADSADYLADVISRSGAVDVGGDRERSASPAKSGPAAAAAKPGGMLTVGMAHLMDRSAQMRVLSGAFSVNLPACSQPLADHLTRCQLPHDFSLFGGVHLAVYKAAAMLDRRTGGGRYRALAGHSLRALRLDLMLTVLHHLQELPGNNWACEEEDAVEVCLRPLQWAHLLL
jgi:hypothetical protein